ncbi:MAG TPA: hypothetical protein VJV39_19665 [Dongiaceae bacterium]|nr:hypothetical protein [Dongiaceae bacterium]
MIDRIRFGAMALGAVVVLGMASAGPVSADTKTPSGSQAPAATTTLKANKPGPVKDIYCTHDTSKSKLPACGDSFKAKCDKIGGTLNDPTGNPDYGACIHDDHW